MHGQCRRYSAAERREGRNVAKSRFSREARWPVRRLPRCLVWRQVLPGAGGPLLRFGGFVPGLPMCREEGCWPPRLQAGEDARGQVRLREQSSFSQSNYGKRTQNYCAVEGFVKRIGVVRTLLAPSTLPNHTKGNPTWQRRTLGECVVDFVSRIHRCLCGRVFVAV